MIHYRPVLNILSALLVFLAAALAVPTFVSFLYEQTDLNAFLITIGVSLGIGIPSFFLTRSKEELQIRDGFIVVSFGWFIFALVGALPFVLSGFIPSYTDAFFETMSGFTTTGASILTNIEALPHGLLFWRSFTHWLGGMGIILLSLAILPLLGVGGMQLFKAEVPGPTPDKLSPRIKHTAELLWGVYLLITVLEILALKLAGMNWFDSMCHTFGTMATGGFSTKNASVGAYNSPTIDAIIILFMIIAGTNFALHYRALRGKPLIYWKDPEATFFVIVIALATLIIGFDVWERNGNDAFRAGQHALFQVVSIITTTGYGTADYEQWAASSKIVLFILMFIGGCAGSTGGGMKVIRSLILVKFGRNELKRLIHPQAVLPVRVGDMVVSRDILTNISGFFLLYVTIFVLGIIFMGALGLDFESAFGSVAATLNNIGPGLGSVGPTENYAHIPDLGKWFLSFLMLAGRLEVYTVLVLFTVSFWKR
ncbi:MAG TPA: TrkH family potassium uptake protein [Caldithrix abyssi]|uniref:TrkH family potassium uptake protein n=1 Tax=Caldithrix abyssi TaxID=187145 RepID=A0A7V4U285_CALAY|nr:TrkH family potassium uptake protein [Caldithrix abyssi]